MQHKSYSYAQSAFDVSLLVRLSDCQLCVVSRGMMCRDLHKPTVLLSRHLPSHMTRWHNIRPGRRICVHSVLPGRAWVRAVTPLGSGRYHEYSQAGASSWQYGPSMVRALSYNPKSRIRCKWFARKLCLSSVIHPPLRRMQTWSCALRISDYTNLLIIVAYAVADPLLVTPLLALDPLIVRFPIYPCNTHKHRTI